MTTPKRWLEDENAEPGVRTLLESHEAQSKPGARDRVWQSLDVHERPSAFWIYAVPAGAAVVVLLAVFSRSAEVPKSEAPQTSPAIAENTYRVQTPSELGRRLTFDRQALDLAPLSMLEVQTESPLAVRLERGRLDVELLRHPPKTPVTVHAGRWTVVGTSFRLSRVGERDIRVRARAATRVERRGGSTHALREGEAFDSALERERASVELSAPEKSGAEAEKPLAMQAAVVPEKATAARGVPSAKRAAPVERPSGVKASPTQRGASLAVPKRKPAAKRSASSKRGAVGAGSTSSPDPSPESSAVDRDQAQLYQRAKAERGDDALELFDRAANLPGPLAELAAYRAARLQMARGRHLSAAERFESLVARFPSGTLGREARLSALECRIQEGQLGRAKAQLDEFLLRYPETERGSDLRFLRAELNRRSGRYRDAIRDYRSVAERVSEPRAAQAIYLTAWCHSEMGESEPAKRALALYLERFPEGPHAAAARAFIDGRRTGRLSEKN